MGQHKYNPTAIAAAKGELPPKPKKMGKRERDRQLYAMCYEILSRPIVNAIEKSYYDEVAFPKKPRKGE